MQTKNNHMKLMKQIHVFTVFMTPESFFDGQFKYLSEHDSEIILVSSDHPHAKSFAERNEIRFIPIEMPRALSPGAILKAIKNLCSIIKHEKPDAVFGHTPVGALCAMIAAKWCSVRNRIYYRHGVIYTTMKGTKYLLFKWEEKFVASLATAVVNVSHSLSRLAVRDKLNPESKQYVIGHGTCGGIDAIKIFNPALLDERNLLAIKDELELSGSGIVFGYCGRICKDKGIPELIDAFELFRNKHKQINAKLLLIGSIDIRDGLPDYYAAKINEDKDIIITGYVDKDKTPYYYAMLDVFVFPSRREGFGMCAIEASALEKPVLVSKVHGCEDAIVEHLTGEYIELNAESLCNSMERMLDTDIRLTMGRNGRRVVLEWYDVRVMWPLVSMLYSKILK